MVDNGLLLVVSYSRLVIDVAALREQKSFEQ